MNLCEEGSVATSHFQNQNQKYSQHFSTCSTHWFCFGTDIDRDHWVALQQLNTQKKTEAKEESGSWTLTIMSPTVLTVYYYTIFLFSSSFCFLPSFTNSRPISDIARAFSSSYQYSTKWICMNLNVSFSMSLWRPSINIQLQPSSDLCAEYIQTKVTVSGLCRTGLGTSQTSLTLEPSAINRIHISKHGSERQLVW